MSGGPDLFVICKSCGSEVSPYITECPYCGSRLRKRAPKLDRAGAATERRRMPRRPKAPSLGRLRAGEIPGIRADRHAYATLALVLVPIAATLAWRAGAFNLIDVAIAGPLHGDWWRPFTALAVYDNTGHELAALFATALFGWLLERRHGAGVVLGVGLAGGVGGMLLALAVQAEPVAVGGLGVALALLGAWVAPHLLALRRGAELEADLLGVAVIAAVLLLMPAAVEDANALAAVGGAVIGLALGLVLPSFAGQRR